MVERENMRSAYRRVVSNRGSAGVDGMTVEELGPYLVDHWSSIRVSLLSGEYRPCAVRQVSIPKSGGRGTRQLGIPTVLDRLVQQALHQVMTPLFDPDFS
jgi:RNA-directed DNA polymerase